MDNPGCRRQYIRTGLVVLLFGLTGILSAAQHVATLLDPDRVVRRELTTIRIRTTIPWGQPVEIQEPELPEGIVWWAYGYARPWIMESADGSTARMVEVLASVRVNNTGFYTLGAFRISSGGRTVISETAPLIGLEPDEAAFPYPVTVNWRPLPGTVWQGQALPVVLEIQNLASLTLADSVTTNTSASGLLEQAPGLGGIDTRSYRNEILYDVPAASWIWTATEAGDTVFPGVRVSVEGLLRAAPGFSLTVNPLPMEARDSGAVGIFRISSTVDEGPYLSGDVVSVRVRIEGEGNLNVLQPPEPSLSGAQLVGRGSSSSYVPGPGGYEGWREERYDFRLERDGEATVRIPGWIWLDPASGGLLRSSPPQRMAIRVQEAAETMTEEDAALLGGDAFRYRPVRFSWRNRLWFLLILPGPAAFCPAFFIGGKGRRWPAAALVLPLLLSASHGYSELITAANQIVLQADEGDMEGARAALEDLMGSAGRIPGLLHDAALLDLKLGRSAEAVSFLREASYLRPGSPQLTASLAFVEERLGLSDQAPLALTWSPALVFSIWLLTVNITFLVLIWMIRKKDASGAVMFAAVVVFLFLSTGFMMYTAGRWSSPTAVVSDTAQPLRKIPGPLAADWIRLPAGTAVSVLAVENEDCLVLTGYGLEGWLPVSSLMMSPGDSR